MELKKIKELQKKSNANFNTELNVELNVESNADLVNLTNSSQKEECFNDDLTVSSPVINKEIFTWAKGYFVSAVEFIILARFLKTAELKLWELKLTLSKLFQLLQSMALIIQNIHVPLFIVEKQDAEFDTEDVLTIGACISIDKLENQMEETLFFLESMNYLNNQNTPKMCEHILFVWKQMHTMFCETKK